MACNGTFQWVMSEGRTILQRSLLGLALVWMDERLVEEGRSKSRRPGPERKRP